MTWKQVVDFTVSIDDKGRAFFNQAAREVFADYKHLRLFYDRELHRLGFRFSKGPRIGSLPIKWKTRKRIQLKSHGYYLAGVRREEVLGKSFQLIRDDDEDIWFIELNEPIKKT